MSTPDFYGDNDGITHHDPDAEARARDATLRRKAGDVIHDYLVQSILWEKGQVEDAPDSDDFADAIIALFRETMLSGEAIMAGIDSVQDDKDWPYWDKNDVVAHILTAALDAALGEL